MPAYAGGDSRPSPKLHKARNMKRLLVVTLLLLAGCDVFSGPEATDPLSEETLLEHLNYLAGDSLYGRGSGTEYELEAAE